MRFVIKSQVTGDGSTSSVHAWSAQRMTVANQSSFDSTSVATYGKRSSSVRFTDFAPVWQESTAVHSLPQKCARTARRGLPCPGDCRT
jgi:hypothetical protein